LGGHYPAAQANVRRLIDWNREDPGIDGDVVGGHAVQSVAIAGAGMMGTAIAAVYVRAAIPVVLTDSNADALCTAPEKIVAELADTAPEADARAAVARLVRTAPPEEAVRGCDLVIESIVETAAAKQKLYGRLEPHLSPETILVSNTSTIPIARLGGGLHHPGRFCGMHFFHPVRHRPLVEIIRGPQTDDATIATLVAHVKSAGRLPIVVSDGPGFLVNRLLLPYMNEALELLREGTPVEVIERAAVEFGMAMGPLHLLDQIGLDTALRGGLVLFQAFSDRIAGSPLLVAMVKAGRLGCKTGGGFYSGAADAAAIDEPLAPAATEILAPWMDWQRPSAVEMVTARLFLTMLLEATRILQEGRVRNPRDIDLGVLFGLGFPGERGGLLRWADDLGLSGIIEALKPLEMLGARVQPTPWLLEMSADGRRFYQD
jgi:3-hydroxyacyl-CoA dehydrogenase/enoyl-CoA hydratase/3-hydroxybutyryl-CoA epimerase/3-hydroxyacyl-CoA dehydrogenase/enoyl-CoA hydratase/3-hydroxybutyryl-CoA epimerase/enoyl-CoA isomerase